MTDTKTFIGGSDIAKEMTRLANREISLMKRVADLECLLQRWYLVHNSDYLELNQNTRAMLPDELEGF